MGVLNIQNHLHSSYDISKRIYILFESLDNNENQKFVIISFETQCSNIDLFNEVGKIYKIHNIEIIDVDFQCNKIKNGILINHSGNYIPDLGCTNPKRYTDNDIGYGCFQIYALENSFYKPLFCMNNWKNTLFDIGLYQNTTGYEDWTFSKSSKLYQICSLFIFQKSANLNKSVLFGDSHAHEFHHLNNMDVHSISAASAKGISKLNSTLQLHKLILNTIVLNNPKTIYFKFGQVDIDYIYYTQSFHFNLYIYKLIQKYVTFIKMLQCMDFHVIVLNINPPTIENNKDYLKNILIQSKLISNETHYNYIYNTNKTEIDSLKQNQEYIAKIEKALNGIELNKKREVIMQMLLLHLPEDQDEQD